MYLNHWCLQHEPFPTGLDLDLFFEGGAQREALARMRYIMGDRRRTALLLGEPGTGKSTLLGVFARDRAAQGDCVALLDVYGLDLHEYTGQLALALGAEPVSGESPSQLTGRIGDRLAANRALGRETVLLFDGVENASPEVLSHLQRLFRQRPLTERLVTSIVAATPGGIGQLGGLVTGSIDLRIDAEPWDETDMIEYVQMALVDAGAEGPVFDYAALVELFHLSGGVPRWVNRLSDHALLIGAAEGAEQVDLETVRAANEVVSLPSVA